MFIKMNSSGNLDLARRAGLMFTLFIFYCCVTNDHRLCSFITVSRGWKSGHGGCEEQKLVMDGV